MKLDQFQNTEQFFKELTANALHGEHSKFEFIRNWDMRCAVKMYKNGLKHVVRVYKNLCKSFKKQYTLEIADGALDIKTLLAYKQFEACYAYYNKELIIAKDILNEHLEYMFSGHLLDTFLFNRTRTPFECIDYRTLPGIWWFKKLK